MTAAPQHMTAQQLVATLGLERAQEHARHALWRAGDLRYLLHEGQIAARDVVLRAREQGLRAVVNTGRRWGKSRLFCVLAAELCLQKPGARVPYAAPTETQVTEFILPHWHLMASHAPKELRPVQKGGDWIFPNGSRVVISGCEDRRKADRLRGPAADLCILDEAGFVPITDYVVRSVLGPQLWTTGGQMLVSSTPPESPDHPFVRLLEEAEACGAYYHASTRDAPHMTPQLIAKAIADSGGEHTIAWQREGEARIVVDPERTVLPEMSEHEALVVREVTRPEHALLHVIGDAGFEDCDAVLFGFYDFVADLDVIEDELIMRHARSDTLDAAIAKKERDLWGAYAKVHRRRIDAPAKVRADMSREVWQAIDPEDAVRRWTAVSRDGGRTKGRLRAGANALRVRIARGRVAIHPRCTTTIAHAKYARWNLTRDDFERVYDEHGKPVHHYDACAGLIYFGRDLDRSTNPYPALPPGVSDATHYIPDDLRKPQRAKIAQIFGRRGRR